MAVHQEQDLNEETNQDDMIEAGTHNYSSSKDYVKPEDPKVLEQLEWFQDQKLALMMHWGPYSQLGLVESWALSDQDGDWSRHGVDWPVDMETFKQQYFDLGKTFNPIRMMPDQWAQQAADAGFKYLIFTTKHHDGFCMWDTQYSDYKVTSPDCPFHKNPNADIVRKVFDAFRSKGLGISAYFSKADWHIPSYWNSKYERGSFTWRGPSYNPQDYPEVWEEFVQYTHNQILELARHYGKLDILWFDAGWVCPQSGQDIRLGEVIDKVRRFQPWVLSADRTVGGPYENYVTPEQCVPEKPLDIPWESCITMGTSFSFKYEDHYKSPRELVNLLVDVVAKGGNLALNVGPQPDGRLPAGAVKSMKGLGEWMRIYGEAIYGTRVQAPYKHKNMAFTRKGNTVYAFMMYPDAKETIKAKITIPFTGKIKKVTLMGSETDLAFQPADGGYRVQLPEQETKETPIAHVFKIETAQVN